MSQTTSRAVAEIAGVEFFPLRTHPDARGSFTEIFRRQWSDAIDPVQWNVVHSRPQALRGVHVHIRHADYLVVVRGQMRLTLRDLRRGSATRDRSVSIDVSGGAMTGVYIPPGVLHGFYFPVESTHIYTMSAYWTPSEEMGCHWSDPAQDFDWGFDARQVTPLLSDRDARLGPLARLLEQMEPYQPLIESTRPLV